MSRAPLTFDEYQSTKYFPALDGLRAIAILTIVGIHMKVVSWTWTSAPGSVRVFFMLSGFLVTTLTLREESRHGSVCLKALYARRLCRIWPAYYVTLLLYCFLIFGLSFSFSIEKRPAFLHALPYYLTYFNEFSFAAAGAPFYQSWFLGVEMKFFLIWPLVMYILFKRFPRGRIAFILVFMALYYALSHLRIVRFLFVEFYVCCLVGCLIALCLHDRRIYERISFFGKPGWHAFFAIVALVTQGTVNHIPTLYVVYPLLMAPFMVGLVTGQTIWGRMLQWRPLVHIGHRTYGVYLLHLLALNAVELVYFRPGTVSWAMSPLYWASAVAVSLVLAEGLYRAVETPGISLGGRLSKRILANRKAAAG